MTTVAISRLMSGSVVRHCKSMQGFFTALTRRLRAKQPRSLRGSYDVMVGDREKSWLPVYFHVPNKFAIMLSHEDIVDSFILSRAVEGT